MDHGLSASEIEAGRKLFAGEWRFVTGAGSLQSLPPPAAIEIAFAGRSNVGKSSLLNALTGRRALARVSKTPGRTQEINFFAAGGLVIADLPGYGFAAASRSKIDRWTGLVRNYLSGRSNLARVFVLIDCRHGLKPPDSEVLGFLDRAAVSYAVVLTKVDALKAAEAEARIGETQAALGRRPAAFPKVFAVSALKSSGLPELRGAIARLVSERGET